MNQHPPSVRRPATYKDVLDAPPHMVAELIRGALHLHPRPASLHARAAFRLAGRLDDPFQGGVGGPGGWHFAVEPELHLGDDVLVPDLAGWRRERMPAAFEIAPDWVCELMSPSTRKLDLTEKRDIYALRDIAFLWLVDPAAGTLEAFALDEGGWRLLGAFKDDEVVEVEPFRGFGFPLSALWPDRA